MKRFFIIIFLFAGISIFFFAMPSQANAAPNIDDIEPNHWAWNDVVGWIDFLYLGNPIVEAKPTKFEGYASSSVGFIALDCGTSPAPPADCDPPTAPEENWFVSADASGLPTQTVKLAGWAWNENIGWVSFCGNDSGGSEFVGGTWVCPTSGNPTYQVEITSSGTAEGEFTGWAWNDVVGWISFNCSNTLTCSGGSNPVDYKVKLKVYPTGKSLTSPIYNMCLSGPCGAAVNTITWQGNNGGLANSVKFQIATDCTSGSLPGCLTSSADFKGPNGQNSTSYTALPNITMNIRLASHNNKQYVRYKVTLDACNMSQSCFPPATPQVDDVIINWSP